MISGLSKSVLQEFHIKFDYSNLNFKDFFINKLIKVELDKIAPYFKNLLLYKRSDSLYRMIKKNSKNVIQCDNPEIKLFKTRYNQIYIPSYFSKNYY